MLRNMTKDTRHEAERKLLQLIESISPPDAAAADAARMRWDSRAKPLGSLGELETDITRIAALTGNPMPKLVPRSLLVFCADNGVVVQGISQSGPEVTAAVARALGEGHSTVCHMGAIAQCRVVPVDIGMRLFDHGRFPGVVNRCIRRSTADCSQGPAMSRLECIQAILSGAELAMEQASAGDRLLCTGEMGIGNTTTATAVACALLNRGPNELTGRGAGLSDAGLDRKIRTIEASLKRNNPDPADIVDVLSKVGGLDIAAMCGTFLGAAASRVPVVIDGCISAAAALCAVRMAPHAKAAMLASHCSAEPMAGALMDALGLYPVISAGLRLGEGSGAVALLPLLDMALSVYRDGDGFGELGIAPYAPQ